jgi:short-subunit dehydrogenase
MDIRLKHLKDQVIVITGASSGIGLTTARMAARRGAKLVLAARNGDALQKLCDELNSYGTSAIHVVADVAKEDEVRAIASAAVSQFGGFDTWINNAGVSIFGRLNEVSLQDQRRLFDTNFWGVVHGSLVAIEHLKARGGALINLGSELSDVGITLQGIYAASKHAVKGFTDSLRMELEEAGAPVSVTLIKPAAIDTMFLAHAKNYMEVEPKLPAPIYAPEAVAKAILFAAEQPKRDIFVGSASKFASAGARYFPQLMDRYMKRFGSKQQRTHRPANGMSQGALYQAGAGLQERLGYDGHVCESSLYTNASLHPKTAGLALAGAGLALAALWKTRPRAALR